MPLRNIVTSIWWCQFVWQARSFAFLFVSNFQFSFLFFYVKSVRLCIRRRRRSNLSRKMNETLAGASVVETGGEKTARLAQQRGALVVRTTALTLVATLEKMTKDAKKYDQTETKPVFYWQVHNQSNKQKKTPRQTQQTHQQPQPNNNHQQQPQLNKPKSTPTNPQTPQQPRKQNSPTTKPTAAKKKAWAFDHCLCLNRFCFLNIFASLHINFLFPRNILFSSQHFVFLATFCFLEKFCWPAIAAK